MFSTRPAGRRVQFHQQVLTDDLDTSEVFMMTLARFSWADGWPEGPGVWGDGGKGVFNRLQFVPPVKVECNGEGAVSRTVVILKLGLSGEMKVDIPGRAILTFFSSCPNSDA